ncbi:MAG: ComF family protein [Kiritimatiellae bacterium]|nr:ComF family protein [Kiritimatiellia bacterium]
MKSIIDIYKDTLDFIWSRFCIHCNAKLSNKDQIFCCSCIDRINYIKQPYCRKCGDPIFGDVNPNYLCHYCTSKKPHFEKARSAIRFNNIIKNAIYELKYGNGTYIGKYISEFAVQTIKEEYPKILFDYVTFVPLHKKRERQRTYNQSQILAKYIAKKLKIPLASDLVIRARYTNTQTLLNFKERSQNISGAFEALNELKLKNKTILLVDDVMTTGATVNECSKALKKGGALQVYVITVARG